MKNLFLFIIFTSSSHAFSQVKEGYFQYSIEVQTTDTSLAQRQEADMLVGAKMELYFANNLSRIDYQMGSMYNMSVRVDRNLQRVISLSTSNAGKFGAVLPMYAFNANTPKFDSSAILEQFNEEKIILGFNCKKYVLTLSGEVTTYWCTDEIDIAAQDFPILSPNVPGFPLEFSSKQDGMLRSFKASNYKFSLEDKKAIFSTVIPEEYELTPMNPNAQ